VSFAWSVCLLIYAVASDPCDEGAHSCVLAFFVGLTWLTTQSIAAVPVAMGTAVLIRYALRGNRGMPVVGLAVVAGNVLTNTILLYYLSTLPSYFR
jgi:hypothetical protein